MSEYALTYSIVTIVLCNEFPKRYRSLRYVFPHNVGFNRQGKLLYQQLSIAFSLLFTLKKDDMKRAGVIRSV